MNTWIVLAYTCMYVYVYMYKQTHTCPRVRMYACIHVHASMCERARARTFTHLFIPSLHRLDSSLLTSALQTNHGEPQTAIPRGMNCIIVVVARGEAMTGRDMKWNYII